MMNEGIEQVETDDVEATFQGIITAYCAWGGFSRIRSTHGVSVDADGLRAFYDTYYEWS